MAHRCNEIPLSDEDYSCILSLLQATCFEKPSVGCMLMVRFVSGKLIPPVVDIVEAHLYDTEDIDWAIYYKTIHFRWRNDSTIGKLVLPPQKFTAYLTDIVVDYRQHYRSGLDRYYAIKRIMEYYKCRLCDAIYWLLLADVSGTTRTILNKHTL